MFKAVHHLGRLDADDFIKGGDEVVDVVELRPGGLVRLDALGPGDDHGVAGAAEVGGNKLGVFLRGIPAQAQPAWYSPG